MLSSVPGAYTWAGTTSGTGPVSASGSSGVRRLWLTEWIRRIYEQRNLERVKKQSVIAKVPENKVVPEKVSAKNDVLAVERAEEAEKPRPKKLTKTDDVGALSKMLVRAKRVFSRRTEEPQKPVLEVQDQVEGVNEEVFKAMKQTETDARRQEYEEAAAVLLLLG